MLVVMQRLGAREHDEAAAALRTCSDAAAEALADCPESAAVLRAVSVSWRATCSPMPDAHPVTTARRPS